MAQIQSETRQGAAGQAGKGVTGHSPIDPKSDPADQKNPKNGASSASNADPTELLKSDHRHVERLFSSFEKATSADQKSQLAAQICTELLVQTLIEEEIFYPAIKAFNGEGRRMVAEALKEHRDIDQLLTQISRLNPSDKNYDDKVETLFENVDHHLEQEEGEFFPFAEENCSREQLEDLGRQIEERKKILDRQMAA